MQTQFNPLERTHPGDTKSAELNLQGRSEAKRNNEVSRISIYEAFLLAGQEHGSEDLQICVSSQALLDGNRILESVVAVADQV